jgi:hypothetical protein
MLHSRFNNVSEPLMAAIEATLDCVAKHSRGKCLKPACIKATKSFGSYWNMLERN